MAMTKKQKAVRARKAAKTRAANLMGGKKTTIKRRRTRSRGRTMSDLSSSSFSVIGMSFVEAGLGAIAMAAANSMVKDQNPTIRMGVNIAGPILISKFTRKPMAAAGAAGIAVVNIGRTLAPNSRFLNDFEVESFMNDLDADSDYQYVDPKMVQGSQFYQLS